MGGMQGHGNMGSPSMGGSMAPGMPGIPGGMPGIPSSTGQGGSPSHCPILRAEETSAMQSMTTGLLADLWAVCQGSLA